jgi:hypothetical protein
VSQVRILPRARPANTGRATIQASELPPGAGLDAVYATLIVLAFTDAPGLDATGIVGNMTIFTVEMA